MTGSLDKISFSEHLYLFPRVALPLPGIVSSTGSTDIVSHSYDWNGLRRGRRQFTIFQWTISGRGALKFEGKNYEILPNQAMLVQVPHRHRYWLPEDSDHWQFVFVTMWGAEIYRLVSDLIGRQGPVWPLLPQSPPVQTALKIYESASRSELTSPFVASALAYQLVMQLADHAFPPSRKNSRFANLRAFAEENLDQNLSVGALAEKAGLSRFHFSREFTADEGLSPSDFLLHAKVEAAARLMGDRLLSIKEIASRTGFRSAHYLTKVFRRFYGCSPRDMRKGESSRSPAGTAARRK